jgi:hypothetical protein
MVKRRLAVLSVTALLVAVVGGAGQAQVPGGWTPLGSVALERNACTTCPAAFATPSRQRTFGLASDSPFPISLAGFIEVACADGSTYQVAVRSATRGGLFQTLPNSCVNLDSKEIRIALTTVALSPADADRRVTLTVYGRLT